MISILGTWLLLQGNGVFPLLTMKFKHQPGKTANRGRHHVRRTGQTCQNLYKELPQRLFGEKRKHKTKQDQANIKIRKEGE